MKKSIFERTRRQWSFLFLNVSWIVLLSPDWAWPHVFTEVLKDPAAFDQQTITISGQVANVVTRYGEAESTSTTFDLLDGQGNLLAVLVSGVPTCKQGEICRITGLFVAQKSLLLPEKVERVAERPFARAGVLFHQQRSGGPVYGGKSFHGVYIPE